MRHNATRFTAVLVVLAVALAPIGAAALPAQSVGPQSSAPSTTQTSAADAQPSMTQEANETADNETDIQPGERLIGVVGVQEAEVSGAIEQREFGIRIAKAASNSSKARVVAETSEALQQRLAELREQKERLQEARANGSMSRGEFAARMASVQTRTETLRQLANETESQAERLPEDVLRANGVNVTAIELLSQHAQNLTGPETAAIARTITGPNTGPMANVTQGPPKNVTTGPADSSNNATAAIEQTASLVERAQSTVDRADERVTAEDGDAADALETAKTELAEAKAALSDARAAAEDGNSVQAVSLAEQARAHANAALEAARDALQASSGDSTTNDGAESTTTTDGTATTAA